MLADAGQRPDHGVTERLDVPRTPVDGALQSTLARIFDACETAANVIANILVKS